MLVGCRTDLCDNTARCSQADIELYCSFWKESDNSGLYRISIRCWSTYYDGSGGTPPDQY
uniref:Uncharacterized protein n=1 Tax=Salmonella phage PMBT22 TaxID=3153513 RepID=A0AAU8GKE8_9CAUD